MFIKQPNNYLFNFVLFFIFLYQLQIKSCPVVINESRMHVHPKEVVIGKFRPESNDLGRTINSYWDI
jgi:hypothetical protein